MVLGYLEVGGYSGWSSVCAVARGRAGMNPCLRVEGAVVFVETCDICGTVMRRTGTWIKNLGNGWRFFQCCKTTCVGCGMVMRTWDGNQWLNQRIRVTEEPKGCLYVLWGSEEPV